MRVLHILNSYSLGGAEQIAVEIINYMSMNGHTFGYCCLSGGNINEYINQDKTKLFLLDKLTKKNIKKVIKEFCPDLIHAHDFTASMITSWSTNIPIVSHIHHNAAWIGRINLKTLVYNFFSYKFKKIIFVSNITEKQYVFHEKIKNKSIVIPNMINKERIVSLSQKNVNHSVFDIVFVGRLEVPKNPLRFITIFENVSKKLNFKITGAIIGQGSLSEQCRKRIEETSIKNLEMLGFKENPYPFIKNSKVLCVTSSFEGYGLVAQEAKILGTPVVANAVGGLCDLVNNDTGFLFHNDDEAVKEILNLLTDKEYYDTKHNNCIQTKDFGLGQVEYCDILQDIYLSK